MKAKPRMLAPSECNSQAKVMAIRVDNIRTKHGWIGIDVAGAYIAGGYGDMARISLADMRKFARWFLRKQRCK